MAAQTLPALLPTNRIVYLRNIKEIQSAICLVCVYIFIESLGNVILFLYCAVCNYLQLFDVYRYNYYYHSHHPPAHQQNVQFMFTLAIPNCFYDFIHNEGCIYKKTKKSRFCPSKLHVILFCVNEAKSNVLWLNSLKIECVNGKIQHYGH